MAEKVFMQGNEAFAESAIRSGCYYFFGYPITPSSEMPEYYAKKSMTDDRLVFVQAETEVAAFNMIAGVAATGKRAMTATSGPGFSLGTEAMSYMSAAGLPTVVVDVMRPGPADGDILAAQGDYFQVVKGGGHGDYNNIVLAPYSVQEMADFGSLSFELAEKYRNPVVVVSDGMLSKMMENVELKEEEEINHDFDWTLTGAKDREHRTITTCALGPEQWEAFNLDLQAKFKEIKKNEQRWEEYRTEDADIIIVAYGTVARIALSTIKIARENGLKVGLIRPITLWPFPEKAFENLTDKTFFVPELSAGQMVEDVKLSVKDKDAVHFYGRLGGITPTPAELYEEIVKISEK